jgi:hypothetical protein
MQNRTTPKGAHIFRVMQFQMQQQGKHLPIEKKNNKK